MIYINHQTTICQITPTRLPSARRYILRPTATSLTPTLLTAPLLIAQSSYDVNIQQYLRVHHSLGISFGVGGGGTENAIRRTQVLERRFTSKQPPDRFFIRSKFAKAALSISQNPEPSLFLGPRAIAGAPQQRSRGLPVRARESEARAAGASHTLINELLRVGTRP